MLKILSWLMFGLTTGLFAQNVGVVKLNALKEMIERPNDTTYVVNFWATWCSPCIQELPYFEQAHDAFAGSKVRIILVSVDFKSQLEKKVKPFARDRKMKSTVLLLDESDANAYINAIDPSWSGAIPATLVVNGHKAIRKFKEEAVTKDELFALIRSTIN